MLSRTYPDPGGQVSRIGKWHGIPPHFGKEDLQHPPTHARDSVQSLHELFERTQAFGDSRIQPLNGTFQRSNHGQQFSQQETMVRRQAALQCRNESVAFARSSQQRQTGQHLRPALALGKHMQGGAAGFAHHLGEDRTELEVGFLEQFMDPIDVARALLLETAAVPGQIAQVALRLGRNERGFEQAMLQQVSDPLGIFAIGLAPWNGFHMLGIDQHDLKEPFPSNNWRNKR
jgi:hypothetical protein